MGERDKAVSETTEKLPSGSPSIKVASDQVQPTGQAAREFFSRLVTNALLSDIDYGGITCDLETTCLSVQRCC